MATPHGHTTDRKIRIHGLVSGCRFLKNISRSVLLAADLNRFSFPVAPIFFEGTEHDHHPEIAGQRICRPWLADAGCAGPQRRAVVERGTGVDGIDGNKKSGLSQPVF